MTHDEIEQRLTTVFQSVFDNPGISISDATTAADIDGWDSIAHIDLIVAVEHEFKVSFNTKDVKALSNVGDFIRLIGSRIK
jgi:acyl carrier protein